MTQFLAEDKSRLELRAQTLKDIEEGHGDAAQDGGDRFRRRSCAAICDTLDRLGIDYDLLSRESEILHLKFWDAAFEMLKQRGAIQFATQRQKRGLLGDAAALGQREGRAGGTRSRPKKPKRRSSCARMARSRTSGKDIAYHLWKFGLLGRDFHYQPLSQASGRPRSLDHDEQRISRRRARPAFGHAHEVFNVIDSRQAYPQQVVVAGAARAGLHRRGRHLKHFAYNVVALTPRCALEMGYEIPPEDAKRPYIEVSGRKGQGVKADDLLDQLEASARKEVDARHADAPEAERAAIAHAIAIGALRYFLLRFTRSTVIAFDFKDALSFEGETGPYVQYAVVRVNGIVRKGAAKRSEFRSVERCKFEKDRERRNRSWREFLAAPAGDDLWELVLLAGSLDARVDAAVARRNRRFWRAMPSSWRRRSTSSTTSTTFSRKKTPRSARFCCGSRHSCASSSSPRSACSASPRRKKCELRDERLHNFSAKSMIDADRDARRLQFREIDDRADGTPSGLCQPGRLVAQQSRRCRDGSTACPRRIP